MKLKLIPNSLSKTLYRSVLVASMATLAVGCGGSSDPVGEVDTTDNTNTGGTDTSGTSQEEIEIDLYSADASWSNNVQISTSSPYASSSYTKGIQRIIYCIGLHPESQTSIIDFADGVFGANTKAAVEEFQGNRNIVVDGIVGEETWAELEAIVRLDPPVDAGNGYNAHSINGADCGLEAQFYQNQTGNGDWKMAKTPASTTMVQFSANGRNED